MPFPKSWVLKLPKGLREQPAWVFVGIMVALVGAGYLTGYTTSSVEQAIGNRGLKGWGGFLVITGLLVTWATWAAKPALEKMALRWLVFALLAYTSWLATAVSFRVAAMTFMLAAILIVLAEIRIGFIKLILAAADVSSKWGDGNGEQP
jgi:hypothetical protein